MYRSVVIMMSLIMLISCGFFNVQTKEQILIANSKMFVKKVTMMVDDSGGYCSSTYVIYKNKTRHVTNAHCCGADLYMDGKQLKISKVDVPNDLCELKDPSESKGGFFISYNAPEVTDSVYTVGFPIYYDLTIDKGRIVSGLKASMLNQQLLYKTTAFTYGGSSGGAALDENSLLLGIVSQANGLAQGAFIPAKTLIEFLN